MITEINSSMGRFLSADDFDPGRPRGAAPVAASGVARMGAARLQDDTERDGSPLMKTIVIVAVAALTANAAGGLLATITETGRPVNSAASAGGRSY
jgi:hypothetical protein